MREYAMNTTGMADEWRDDAEDIASSVPDVLPVVGMPVGRGIRPAFESRLGGIYVAEYDYELDGDEWVARLKRVTCDMPPRPPQIRSFDENVRVPMCDKRGFSAAREAEQRRKEWAEVARAT